MDENRWVDGVPDDRPQERDAETLVGFTVRLTDPAGGLVPPPAATAEELRARTEEIPDSVRIRIGDVVDIPPACYWGGTRPLTLRVTDVNEHPHPGVEWLRVLGVEILGDGTDGPEHDIMVRISVFPRIARNP